MCIENRGMTDRSVTIDKFLNNKKICWHVWSATLHHRVLERKTIPDYRDPTYRFQIQSFWNTDKNKPDDFLITFKFRGAFPKAQNH